MLSRCLLVIAGAYSLGLFQTLPAAELVPACTLLAAGLLCRPRLRAAGCFVAGFVAMWIGAWQVIDDRLEPHFAGDTIALAVRIAGFPVERNGSLRMLVEPQDRPDLPARIHVGWHRPDARPQPGETWHLRVRLRVPHGYANPDGFDYEGYLFRERIGATGYVVRHAGNRLLPAWRAGPLQATRHAVAKRIDALLPNDDAAAVLLAIGVGARHRITRLQWDRYAVTGLSHLMAISGLHVGLAVAGVLGLAWAALSLLLPRGNVRDAALLVAVVAAGCYVMLSGFAVPARRAFLMALLAAVAVLLRRRVSPVNLVCLPCLVMFFADPVSILAPGFKLSFAAVAIILWMLQRYVPPGGGGADGRWHGPVRRLRRLVGLQWLLLVGLFPLTVLIFGRFSLLAPVTNLVALPVFSFISVPFGLLGMLLGGPLDAVGDLLLKMSYRSIQGVLWLVAWFASLPRVRIDPAPLSGLALLLVALPACHALLPPGWPGRNLGPLALIAIVFMRPASTPPRCLDFHVLDVGQGLAVVLRAGPHTLLYDTGPAFRSGNSAAVLAIEPFLRARGIDRLDTLVVSHSDQDHAGGVRHLVNSFPTASVLVGEFLPALDLPQSRCRDTASFTAHGSRFRFLHMAGGATWQGNNASCVLEVTTGTHRLLLTGDIESPVEAVLVHNGALAPVDAVIVPHHGSRTSSSDSFVQALRPELAIVSAGYGNRWDFPKTDVRRRWEAAGAELLNTATGGAISRRICAGEAPGAVRAERVAARRYWHHFPHGEG